MGTTQVSARTTIITMPLRYGGEQTALEKAKAKDRLEAAEALVSTPKIQAIWNAGKEGRESEFISAVKVQVMEAIAIGFARFSKEPIGNEVSLEIANRVMFSSTGKISKMLDSTRNNGKVEFASSFRKILVDAKFEGGNENVKEYRRMAVS